MNLGCKVMLKNESDDKIREIFEYLLKIASYDKNLVIRQKARVLTYIFNPENKLDLSKIYEADN
jgi:hypothetical protein